MIVGGERLLLTVDEWADRMELAKPHVMSWVSARVYLEGAKPARSRGRVEPFWYEAIRRANPGRR